MKANKWQMFVWLLLFGLSRIWVIAHPPYHKVIQGDTVSYEGYSDVKQDYERYANMWKYGLTPYYEHLYEYPPASIPFVYLPLEIDLAGWGNYYTDYRIFLSLVELMFFVILLLTVYRFNTSPLIKIVSLGFYILSGMWAKDYWYEGLDLIFSLSLGFAFMSRYLLTQRKYLSKILFWTFFWLSTALKFMTLPLALPFFLLAVKKWKEEVVASAIGFMLVWAIPLLYFRTALSVSVVFHLGRPLKYGSLGTLIIKTINDVTHTEIQTDILPHLPMAGPVTQIVERTFSILFPLAMLATIALTSVWAWKKGRGYSQSSVTAIASYIRISLIYFLILFLTTKVFSSPFHIWYVPLLAMFPYAYIKQQVMAMVLALFMLGMDTTPYFKVSDTVRIAMITLEHIRDWFRFVPMVMMLVVVTHLTPTKPRLNQAEIGVSKA